MTHSGPLRGLTRAIRLGLLLSATNALASIGPFGGNVTGLAIDAAQPDTLYAATRSGGIFKSEDGGATWFEANDGIALRDRSRDHTRVRLTIDPSQLETLYMVDGGTAAPFCRALMVRPPGCARRGLARGGGAPGAVEYSVRREWLWLNKSTDSGASWVVLTSLRVIARSLAVDPTNGQILYAGTNDGGSTWAPVNEGIDNFGGVWVVSLAIDPIEPRTIYRGTLAGLYKSTDGGERWVLARRGRQSPGRIDPRPNILYVDLGRDDGREDGGVLKSLDGGLTWSHVTEGTTINNVSCLAVDPVNPERLYVGTFRNSVYASGDSGQTWR